MLVKLQLLLLPFLLDCVISQILSFAEHRRILDFVNRHCPSPQPMSSRLSTRDILPTTLGASSIVDAAVSHFQEDFPMMQQIYKPRDGGAFVALNANLFRMAEGDLCDAYDQVGRLDCYDDMWGNAEHSRDLRHLYCLWILQETWGRNKKMKSSAGIEIIDLARLHDYRKVNGRGWPPTETGQTTSERLFDPTIVKDVQRNLRKMLGCSGYILSGSCRRKYRSLKARLQQFDECSAAPVLNNIMCMPYARVGLTLEERNINDKVRRAQQRGGAVARVRFEDGSAPERVEQSIAAALERGAAEAAPTPTGPYYSSVDRPDAAPLLPGEIANQPYYSSADERPAISFDQISSCNQGGPCVYASIDDSLPGSPIPSLTDDIAASTQEVPGAWEPMFARFARTPVLAQVPTKRQAWGDDSTV